MVEVNSPTPVNDARVAGASPDLDSNADTNNVSGSDPGSDAGSAPKTDLELVQPISLASLSADAPHTRSNQVTLPTIEQTAGYIKQACQEWKRPFTLDNPLASFLLVRHALLDYDGLARNAVNELLVAQMRSFRSEEEKNWGGALEMRYSEKASVRETARRYNVEETTIQKWQQLGWRLLAERMIEAEHDLRIKTRREMTARLAMPGYSELFGVADSLQALSEKLADPDGPRIVAIEGMGGMGKTTLADALMRHLIATDVVGSGLYMGCAWITARCTSFDMGGVTRTLSGVQLTRAGFTSQLLEQLYGEEGRPIGLDEKQLFSMAKHRLARQPHLVVVDNLETVSDEHALIDTLLELIPTTRFVLTTRNNLFQYPEVFHHKVDALSADTSLALVRSEALQRNLPFLAEAGDDELMPIFETVGGNPLAIRLVVGQTHIHSLQEVLQDLVDARGKPIERLYSYIFWHAWNSLDEPSREAWLLMPIANGDGLGLPQLAEIADIEADDLRHALEQLVTLNLVDRHGNLNESRYTIHSLTRTFLQNQVLKWDERMRGEKVSG